MSKVLVFSGPYADHHKSFVVTSKSNSYVDYVFGMNEWEELGSAGIYELEDEFLDEVENSIGKKVESENELKEYYTKLIQDSSVTLDKFSNMLVKSIIQRRGSWASYIFVKVGN
jgi:hypothetical protein